MYIYGPKILQLEYTCCAYMHVYTYMHVLYIYACTCMYILYPLTEILAYTCIYVYTYIYEYTYIHTYTYICILTYIYIHTCIYVHTYIYRHTYIYVYTYIQLHIHTITYIYNYAAPAGACGGRYARFSSLQEGQKTAGQRYQRGQLTQIASLTGRLDMPQLGSNLNLKLKDCRVGSRVNPGRVTWTT
jgi:hypothetical protein